MIDYHSDYICQSITTAMPLMTTFKRLLQQHSCDVFIQGTVFEVKDIFGIISIIIYLKMYKDAA